MSILTRKTSGSQSGGGRKRAHRTRRRLLALAAETDQLDLEFRASDVLCETAGRSELDGPGGDLPRGHGETVMVVDDERPLVALAREMLAKLGYKPVGFESSSAALEAFRAQPRRFDLILTDDAMPDLVGTELARAIRRLSPLFRSS
jgi:PleD family two-component response regulator